MDPYHQVVVVVTVEPSRNEFQNLHLRQLFPYVVSSHANCLTSVSSTSFLDYSAKFFIERNLRVGIHKVFTLCMTKQTEGALCLVFQEDSL